MVYDGQIEFLQQLGFWVRWERDLDAEDDFSFAAVRLPDSAVAELQLEPVGLMDQQKELLQERDVLDGLPDEDLVSPRRSAVVLLSLRPAASSRPACTQNKLPLRW